jgi:hypothetical protein
MIGRGLSRKGVWYPEDYFRETLVLGSIIQSLYRQTGAWSLVCRDPHGQYTLGNLLEESLQEIWNGTKLRKFRKAVFNNQASVGICQLCPGEGVARLF